MMIVEVIEAKRNIGIDISSENVAPVHLKRADIVHPDMRWNITVTVSAISQLFDHKLYIKASTYFIPTISRL